MSQLGVFLFGCFVSSLVAAAFFLLTYGAVEAEDGVALGAREPTR